MSNTVDERVVKMQFDNAQFEKNVQTSLGTLGKLKEALRFDKVDMSSVASNIEKITEKVTGLGGIWNTVLDRVNNKIVDVGQQLVSTFAFKPPTDGFNEYELKMDSLKVIMESSHESLETVNKYLNELNKYSDQTIYSFSDMTSSIGKFTNAGVDLDTAVNAIKGIANEAALAGASTNDASRAMYNFAQALSAGSVKLIDWKSIENANMATQEFKNELIKTAVELGTLTKVGDDYISTTTNMQGKTSEAFNATKGFNDSLAHQWMTTDVLTKTLGRYANAETDIGARATKAATEVRTFSAMMDSLKEAVGSGWAQTWEIIFGNMEEATEMWTAVNDVLSGFIDKFSDARNDLLQGWKDLGGRTELLKGLANVFKILGNVIKPASDALKVIFPPMTAERLADITKKFADFTEKVKRATENFPMKLFEPKDAKAIQEGLGTAAARAEKFSTKTKAIAKDVKEAWDGTSESSDEAIKKTTENLEKLQDVVKRTILGEFKNNDTGRRDLLKEAGYDPDTVQEYVNKVRELSNGSWDLSDEMMKAAAESLGLTEKVAESTKEATEETKKSIDEYEAQVSEITANGNVLTSILITLGGIVKDTFGSGLKIVGAFGRAFRDSTSPIKITLGQVREFDESLKSLSEKFKISDETLEKIYKTGKSVISNIKTAKDLAVEFAMSVLPSAIRTGETVIKTVGGIAIGMATFVSGAINAITESGILTEIVRGLSNGFNTVSKWVSVAAEALGYLGQKFADGGKYMSDYLKEHQTLQKVTEGLGKAFDKLGEKVRQFGGFLGDRLGFKTFDEFKVKVDEVVDKLSKDFFVPGFQRLVQFVEDLVSGKANLGSVTKLFSDFGKTIGGAIGSVLFSTPDSPSIFDRIGTFFSSGDISGKFSNFVGMLKNAGTVIKEFFKGILIGSGFEGLKSNKLVDGLDKLVEKGDKTSKGLLRFRDTTKDVLGDISSVFSKNNAGKSIGSFVGSLQNADKNVPKSLVEKLNDLSQKIKDFFVNLDLKKTLLAVRVIKSITSIFNGIKLTKSFSGMADNIGGFFEKLKDDGLGLVPEESKFTKLLKVAVSIFLVAKAIAMISDIPENRIWSSVGIVAGIAAVLAGIVIAFEKIKPVEGADLSGAAKTMLALSIAIYIIGKSIEMLGDQDPAALLAGGAAIAAMLFALTKAAQSLKDLKINKADALAPIGFAIALKILTGVVLSFAKADPADLLQGIIITALMMQLLKGCVKSLKDLKAGPADVVAPLTFALALQMLLFAVVGFGLIPPMILGKGIVVTVIMFGLLEKALESIKGLNFSGADAAAPLALVAAITLLVGSIVILGLMPSGVLIQGGITVTLLGAALIGMMFLMSLINKYVGGVDVASVFALIGLAAAIDLLALAVIPLGLFKRETIEQGVNTVTWLAVLLLALAFTFTMISQLGSIKASTIPSLIGLIASIALLGAVAAGLGSVDPKKLAIGALAVFFLGLILSALGVAFAKINRIGTVSIKTVLSMIIVVGAIALLGKVATSLGGFDVGTLAKGIIAVGFLGLIIVAIEAVLAACKYTSGSTSIGQILGIIAIVVGLKLLASTAVNLGNTPLPVLVKGVGVLIVLSTFLGALTGILGIMKFSVADILAPIAVVAAVMVLVMAVKMLGSMDSGQLAQGTFGVVAILVGLAVALTALCALAGPLMGLAIAFAVFGAGALLIGTAFLQIANGMLALSQAMVGFIVAMQMISAIPITSIVQLASLLTLLGLGVWFLCTVLMSAGLPAIAVLLALGAAFLMIGGGLYLFVSALEKFVNMAGQVGEAFANMVAYIGEHADEIFAYVQNAVLNGLSYLADHAGEFLEKGGELIMSVAHGIMEHGPEVLAKVGEALGKAKDYVIEHMPEWLETGKELLTNVINGIGEMAGNLLDKAVEVVGNAKEAILDQVGEWVDAGKQMVAGLIDGIGKKAGELVEKAKGVVSNAIDAARNLLRINSPSKVFRDMGYSVDEGFILGMERMSSKVASASASVASGLIDSAKGPLEQLADLMSGPIMDDPTITPVLDLSEIQNGANRLYSMLPDSERYSFSGNLQLAGDASLSVNRDMKQKQENENAMMSSLINAINGLSALIGTTGNVYNVNGLTYDDGSNVSSAVRALIHAAKVEGRA